MSTCLLAITGNSTEITSEFTTQPLPSRELLADFIFAVGGDSSQ
jgi:hypothetical protein